MPHQHFFLLLSKNNSIFRIKYRKIPVKWVSQLSVVIAIYITCSCHNVYFLICWSNLNRNKPVSDDWKNLMVSHKKFLGCSTIAPIHGSKIKKFARTQRKFQNRKINKCFTVFMSFYYRMWSGFVLITFKDCTDTGTRRV